ncbi:MAG: hypothetical protein ACK5GU_03740 [Chloroflexota bacterium]
MRNAKLTHLLATIVLIATVVYSIYPAQAAAPNSSAMLTINGGGGTNTTNGIKLTFNVADSGEQLVYDGKKFLFSNGDFGFHLNIGGTLYTSFNGSNASLELSEANKFTNLTYSGLTGTASISGGATSGSGSAAMTYTVSVGGRTYTVKRTITYTHPNKYYEDDYEIIIPAGNTANVVFYKGGDAAPYEADTGVAAYFDAPVRNVQNIDTASGNVIGIKEVFADSNMAIFDGAVAERYYYSYDEVTAGNNIGYRAEAQATNGDPLDVGLMVQQNIGSSAGTYNVNSITYVGGQEVTLDALWANRTVTSLGRLNLALINNTSSSASGIGFTFTLPTNLTAGAVYTNCTGTASGSGTTITVSGVNMGSMTSCLLEVDVASTIAGNYTIDASNVSADTGITDNAIVSNTTTFTYSSPTFTRTPSPTLSPTNTLTPSNTRTPSNTPTETFTPSNTRTPSNTLTPSNTNTPSPTSTANPLAITDIAVGQSFVLGLTTNGNMVTWGLNNRRQSTIPSFLFGTSIREVEVGSNWSMALRTNNTLVGWGSNDFGQLTIPTAANSRIKTFSASFGHVVALKLDGTVVSWGRNNMGQTSVPRTLKPVIAVSAGHQHSLALQSDGTVATWGKTTVSQPRLVALLRDITAISAGFDHSLALKRDGTVVCWQDNSESKQIVGQCKNVKQLKNIVEISAGRQFSIARDNEGRVFVWGSDAFGQLNIAQERSDAIMVKAGYVNAVVAYADGSILTTGSGMHGARVSRTATNTGVVTPSPAPATWTPAPPTFTPRPTRRP